MRERGLGMTVYQLENDGGFIAARFAADRLMPIRLAGQPVAAFGPGWHGKHVYAGFAPVYLLELRHDNGDEATWYLDATMNRTGGELHELTAETRVLIARRYAELSGSHWEALLASPSPAWPAGAGDVATINDGVLNARTLKGIAHLPCAATDDQVEWVGIADIQFGGSVLVREGGTDRHISVDHLRTILSGDLQENFLGALDAGTLSFPSPVTGRPTTRVHALYIDHMLLLYRCVDEEHSFVFYIVAAGHHLQTVGVLLPTLNQAFYFTPAQQHFAQTVCQHLRPRVSAYLRRAADFLPAYFASQLSGFVAPLWGAEFHIGHHLWNELSGLSCAVATVATRSLPHIAVLGRPGEGEAYGEVGQIFPELAPLVIRGMPGDAEFLRLCFEAKLQVLRITGDHVSANLRDRIMAQARTAGGFDADRHELARLRQERTPIVVLGLRVENRTVAEFELFAQRVAEHLQHRLGRVAIVLDGHNSRGDGNAGSYPSFTEARATMPPVEVEMHIARVLHQQFAGSGVTIIDNIGRPMSAGLFWIAEADFFISPWGAGLAKYRWVCNKPGVILSSRWVLTEKGDLHIYDRERYMTAPTPVKFIDPEDVFDIADEPVLVQVFEPHHPMYYNFKVSMNRLYRLIDALIAESSLAVAA